MGLRNRGDFKDEQCFFITTSCNKMKHLFKNENYFLILGQSLRFNSINYNSDFLRYVLMPNHIHFIVYFKAENRISDFMRDFKKFTSGEIRRQHEKDSEYEFVESLRYEKREQKFKIWQDRFDDVVIYSKKVLETKLDYIHNNPMQEHWNLVKSPELYKYSLPIFTKRVIKVLFL